MQMDELDKKLITSFPGKVVRKDLATPLKGQLNVPIYVLEYLLGKYCSSADENVIETGLEEVKRILTENYVRPDQSEVLKSKIKEKGSHRVIDKVKVRLVETEDRYWAELTNLQLNYVNIDERLINKYEKLLAGGIWAIVDLTYDPNIFHRGVTRPFIIRDLRPIQLAVSSFEEIKEKRQNFTTDEWMDIMIRTMGLEPSKFTKRVKYLLLMRLIPLVENNFNLVELGPRGTGKSYVYRELSPYSILISGGETTVPSLFVSHIGRGRIGLVGLWDVVAFDEVAGLTKLRDTAAIQIMKDYMESGSFSRGREEITALASMAFVGNIYHDIEHLVQTSHLFIPFPPEMQDLAFLDRFHLYLPGWEIPKMQPDHLTTHFGFVVDYIAEFFKDSRKLTHATAIDEYFELGDALNKRDEKAVRKIVSGLIKLLHPDGKYKPQELEEYLYLALEMRRRVKEQLKRMGGVEYWNTKLGYKRLFDGEENFARLPEESTGIVIPNTPQAPGVVYTVGWDMSAGRASLFKIEVQLMKGTGKIRITGAAGRAMREAIRTAFDFIKARAKELRIEKILDEYDVHVQVVNLMQAKEGSQTGVAFFVAMLSALNDKPVKQGAVIVGEMSIQGGVLPLENLGESIQVIKENGGKKIFLPTTAVRNLSNVPPPLIADLEISLYETAKECAEKCFAI